MSFVACTRRSSRPFRTLRSQLDTVAYSKIGNGTQRRGVLGAACGRNTMYATGSASASLSLSENGHRHFPQDGTGRASGTRKTCCENKFLQCCHADEVIPFLRELRASPCQFLYKCREFQWRFHLFPAKATVCQRGSRGLDLMQAAVTRRFSIFRLEKRACHVVADYAILKKC